MSGLVIDKLSDFFLTKEEMLREMGGAERFEELDRKVPHRIHRIDVAGDGQFYFSKPSTRLYKTAVEVREDQPAYDYFMGDFRKEVFQQYDSYDQEDYDSREREFHQITGGYSYVEFLEEYASGDWVKPKERTQAAIEAGRLIFRGEIFPIRTRREVDVAIDFLKCEYLFYASVALIDVQARDNVIESYLNPSLLDVMEAVRDIRRKLK